MSNENFLRLCFVAVFCWYIFTGERVSGFCWLSWPQALNGVIGRRVWSDWDENRYHRNIVVCRKRVDWLLWSASSEQVQVPLGLVYEWWRVDGSAEHSGCVLVYWGEEGAECEGVNLLVDLHSSIHPWQRGVSSDWKRSRMQAEMSFFQRLSRLTPEDGVRMSVIWEVLIVELLLLCI